MREASRQFREGIRRWGGFLAGFLLASAVWIFGIVWMALDESGTVNSICHPGSGPNPLYIEDDGERDLVCAYLKGEIWD